MGECSRLIDFIFPEPYVGNATDVLSYSGSYPYITWTDSFTQPTQIVDAVKNLHITVSKSLISFPGNPYTVTAGSSIDIVGYYNEPYASITFTVSLSSDGKTITITRGGILAGAGDYYLFGGTYTFSITGDLA